jgi:hypothetical protein
LAGRDPLKLLVLGIVLLGTYLFLTVKSRAPDSSLIPVSGQLRSAKTYVELVTDSHGHESHSSELVFFLDDGKQKYQLFENIAEASYDNTYEDYRKKLRYAERITVWIRDEEKDDWTPQVFQIKADDSILFSAEETRISESRFNLLFLVLGLLSIAGYIVDTPNKIREWFLKDS